VRVSSRRVKETRAHRSESSCAGRFVQALLSQADACATRCADAEVIGPLREMQDLRS